MTHPTNTTLSQEDIRRIALEAGCDPEQDDGALVAAIIRRAERAVIEKLATGDAVPLMRVRVRTDYHTGDVLPVEEISTSAQMDALPNDTVLDLYDAAALAAARQQGRNEGREEARAELGPDAERYRWLKEQRDDQVWNHAMSDDEKERADTLDAAIDAARQPTQKEAT